VTKSLRLQKKPVVAYFWYWQVVGGLLDPRNRIKDASVVISSVKGALGSWGAAFA
jgi:hypothetical protein